MSENTLLDHLDVFTGFVRSRTGDPDLAADIVQDSLLKALRSETMPQDDEGVVPWFYRILRNGIIDAHRRATTRDKTLQQYAQEVPAEPSAEDRREVCRCLAEVLPALPSADAELLRRIDLEGESATDLARATEARVNTVNVRLLRARKRLRDRLEQVCGMCAKHGCLDCDCG